MRLGKDNITTMHEFITLTATERDAPGARGISFDIIKDGRRTGGIKLYKEDIVPDKYHLYKIGTVSDIRASGDIRLDIFEINYEWINLSGISTVFPMNKCDVYLCMKFEGEMYGGSPENTQAVYLDYALVVRREP